MSKTATARATTRQPPHRAILTRRLSSANREAIRRLEEWMRTPPVETEAFWRDFERELKQNRLSLRKPR